MLKPFFTNPFKSLATRTGIPIGDAGERGMLAALGGSDGFRKRYQRNADGSTTMLQTKNGMPRFSTSPVNTLVITVGDQVVAEGGANIHVISFSMALSVDTDFPFSLSDVDAVAGTDYISPLTDVDFSNGVVIVGGTITVPAGVSTFTATVTTLNNPAVSVSRTYQMHVGSAVGVGTIIDI